MQHAQPVNEQPVYEQPVYEQPVEQVEEVVDMLPKQEQIEIDDYFEPETVKMMIGEHLQITGEANGMQFAYLEGKSVIIERCRFSL